MLCASLVLCVAWLSLPASAQSPVLPQENFAAQLWTTADGLPVDWIYDITQTTDGYLWLATPSGLVRFDGLSFTTFSALDYPALPSNHIRRLFADSAGRLWIMTFLRHLVVYENGVFTRLDESRGLPGRVTDKLIFTRPVYEAPDGTVWVTHDQGVGWYQDGMIKPFFPETLDREIASLYWDTQGRQWIGDRPGNMWRSEQREHLELLISSTTFREAHQDVLGESENLDFWPWNVYEDSSGKYWIATESAPFIYAEDNLSLFSEEGKPVPFTTRGFFKDEQSRIWFHDLYDRPGVLVENKIEDPSDLATPIEGRPFLYASPFGQWTYRGSTVLYKNRTVFQFTSGTTFFSIYHDNEGNAWIASTSGLLQLRPTPVTVTDHPIADPFGSRTIDVYPVLQDRNGTIWGGTIQGDLLKLTGTNVEAWSSEDNFFVGHPWAMLEDRDGTMWVGGYGIFALDQNSKSSIESSTPVPGELRDVHAIIQDSNGDFWVGAEYGLARGAPSGEWHVFTERDGYSPFWTQALHEATDGSIWIGTFGKGLFRYRDGIFQHWDQAQGFCSNNISSFYEDVEAQHMWVATSDQGICRLTNYSADSLRSATIAPLNSHHGLHYSTIHVILEDDVDRFWMGSPQGIFSVSKADLNAVADGQLSRVSSVLYDERDGMNSKSTGTTAQPAGIKDDQGRLWFPTKDGIVTIDPSLVKQDAPLPPVRIETATVDDVTHHMPGMITLSPDQRALTVTYTALSFVKSTDIRFQYRLLGLDDTWQEAGTSRMAQFTNLDPGTYTFEVKAANSNGVWNETPATLTLVRKPFFYETTLFNLFLVLCALGGTVGLIRYRTHRVHKRNLELEQKVEERTEALEHALVRVGEQAEDLKALDKMKSQFFANVSHEFRTPLTLIKGHVADVQESRYGSLPPKAEQALSKSLTQTHRLQSLVEQLLDLSRLEANQLDLRLEPGDLDAFLKRQVLYFSSLAEKRNIALVYHGSHASTDVLFDAIRLEKVISNLVGNALKFTPAGGSVMVSLQWNKASENAVRQAIIKVADTGIGIAPDVLPNIFQRFFQADSSSTRSYDGIGVGLALVKDLVELHGGTIRAASTLQKGSAFTVTLPAPPLPRDEPTILPVEQVGVSPVSTESPAEETKPHTVTGRVLIVDDNDDVRSFLREHLDESFEVFEAADGQAAWELLQETKVDTIVSDVMMPRMDGFMLLQQLKTHAELRTIPVLMLTARADEEDRLQGLQSKADAYIAKPFNVTELKLRVRNMVVARQAMEEQYQRKVVAVEAEQLDLKDEDTIFLEQAQHIVEEHMSDQHFSVEEMAERLHMSRMTLNRRMKGLTNLTPASYIRQLRLERARQMLEQGHAQTISEIAVAVGYKDGNYFSRAYSKAYGVPPSAHIGAAVSDPNP